MNGRRNLCRTTWLCPVTYNTAYVPESIPDCFSNPIVISSAKIGDPRSGTAGCTDRSAESGKSTDIVFDIHGNQIAYDKSTIEFLLGNLQRLCILHYRHAYGNSLITRAGIDYYRQWATAHSGIRSRCRSCAGTGLNIMSPGLQNGLSHTGSPGIVQTFLRNGKVHLNLSLQKGLNRVQIHRIRILQNPL